MSLVSAVHFQESFAQVGLFDNVECITLKLKPMYWDNLPGAKYRPLFEADFIRYCSERKIDYCLFMEVGRRDNVHYHGLMGFPSNKIKRSFTSWYNKYYGLIKVSPKGDLNGWYNYCTKQHHPPQPDSPGPRGYELPYLFDPLRIEPVDRYKNMTVYYHIDAQDAETGGPPDPNEPAG